MTEIRILLLVITFAFCEACFVRNGKVEEVDEHLASESNVKTGDGPADTTSIRIHLTALTKMPFDEW